MKRIVLWAALIFITVSPVLAQAATMTIRGEVGTVDTAASTLSVKEKTKEVTLSVTDKTIIMEGKEKKALVDIKSGEKIKAKVETKDGKTIAKSIQIATAKTAAPPKTEAK